MPDAVVFWHVTRRTARSGAIWGIVFATLVAGSAVGYTGSFTTEASRQKLAQGFGGNVGISALIGPARQLETAAGYTEWRTIGLCSIVGAIWALLLGTRLLRGEEESGRWELLLSGRTNARRATAQTLVGLFAGWLVLWTITAASGLAVGPGDDIGFSTAGSLLLAAGVGASALMFLAIGALTSQLLSTRRGANQLAAAIFGVAYLIRLVADSADGLQWLRWASPLGWPEELRPLTGARPLALLPVVAFAVAAGVGSVVLAGRRDVGGAVIAEREAKQARLRLLDGQGGLTVRLLLTSMVSWTIGLAVTGAVFGMVAQAAADSITGSDVIEEALARLGGASQGAAAYLGLTFSVSAATIAFAAASQVVSTRAEEAEGRVDNVVVAPVDRRRWLLGRVAAAAALVVVISTVSGITAWFGAASQHTPIGFGTLVLAGLNLSPPGLLVIGIGTLVFGVQPRAVAVVVYAIVAWSFIAEFIGAIVDSNRWLLDTSLLHHIAPAPATDVRWSSVLVLVVLAALTAAAGIVTFGRRDLATA